MKQKTKTDISALIPQKLKVEYLSGKVAFEAQQVALFNGIHPVIIEMGKTLAADLGKTARFKLGDDKMKEGGDAVLKEFIKGLRKVAKALTKDPVKINYGRDGDTLVFWFAKKQEALA
jgi:hypothetical protein